ncbi:MAG: NAD(P)/FAD-dependent oxidoreductase [Candidatus Aenigmarchaeota archaeon]|nr:NAD(P)/FAD-dependent oxidoreductase [Candidatus Aenigmarchaeota archaeon]
MYDVVIVGAGPVGCKTAELIAKRGFDVLVLEEHSEIGLPIKCSGLVSRRIFKLSRVSSDIIVNRVRKARFHIKENYIELKSKKTVYVIDRQKFDKEIAEKAEYTGAEIKDSTKFGNYKKDKVLEVKTTKGSFKTKILIGADGANSTVARVADIKLPDNLLTGIQFTVESHFDPETVELWFGSSICPDFFGWVIPENENSARVGLASSEKVGEHLDNFIKMRFKHEIKPKNKIVGLIRYGLIETSASDNVMLVGDAASQIKPFSGGGLIYGMIGAKIAADACIKTLKERRYDSQFLKKNYDDVWKKKLAWPIRKGLFLKNLIHSFSDRQLSFLFSAANITKIRRLLEFTDMDLL